jgi:hypothetical protein
MECCGLAQPWIAQACLGARRIRNVTLSPSALSIQALRYSKDVSSRGEGNEMNTERPGFETLSALHSVI